MPRKADPPASVAAAALLLAVAAVALAVGLAGCAAESKLFRSDPSFTAAALSAGGVAVVSVVKKEEVEQVRPPLIAALEEVLRSARPDLRLISAGRVADDMGLGTYRRILRDYQASGSLDSAGVRTLARAVDGEARYAIVARVTSDALRRSERGISPQDSSRYRFFRVLLVTGRDARVDVHVYDLAKRAVVYYAQYAGSAEDSRPARYGLEGGGAAAGGGVTVGLGSRDAVPPGVPDSLAEQWGRYPPAPTLAGALTEAFRAFAADLPR
jgi:hypothetical protein